MLDNNPAFNGPNAQGWLAFGSWNSDSLNPGDTVSNIEWQTGSPIDLVTLKAPFANVMSSPDPPIEVELNAQFETWLVYRSGSGIWVGIGKVALTISRAISATMRRQVPGWKTRRPRQGGLAWLLRGARPVRSSSPGPGT